MIKQLLRTTGRQPAIPVAVLALSGIVGAVALSRSGPARNAGRNVLASLPSGERAIEQVGEALDTFSERTGETVHAAREHLPSPRESSPLERIRDEANAMGVSEKTVAVFAATLLAKSVTGYLRWRGEEKARAQAEALASDEGQDFGTRLQEHTVVELRQMAADREIDGRSSMNKDELIAALEGDR